MSGLEKAIRNALAQSERNNADIRARIYHSARQALDAGLRKQDVTDPQVVEAQKQRLEAKIREIEFEERQRLAIERARTPAEQPVDAPMPPLPSASPDAVRLASAPAHRPDRPQQPEAMPAPPPLSAGSAAPPPEEDELASLVGAPRRNETTAPTRRSGDGDLGGLDLSRRGGADPSMETRARRTIKNGSIGGEKTRRWWQGKRKPEAARSVGRGSTGPAAAAQGPRAGRLDVAAGKDGRPRKRRRWISGLVLPLLVLGAAGWGVWWAGSNGLIVMPDLSGGRPPGSSGSSRAPAGFEPGRGFSEDWAEVFAPNGTAGIAAAGDARVEPTKTAGTPAVRITSQSSGPSGEVAFEVPPEILREMAGKSSTVAITLQTAADRSVEVAVRCDFGSLGGCARHRFRATQEKIDALFRVNFDRSLAPNRPGRIYLNSDVLGGSLPVYVFSMRILPGQ